MWVDHYPKGSPLIWTDRGGCVAMVNKANSRKPVKVTVKWEFANSPDASRRLSQIYDILLRAAARDSKAREAGDEEDMNRTSENGY
uniref:Uncharacterized protein n=1 Tax=bacterium enrichment culture clone fosmid MGS-K1 TaxID=1549356 RepID=A0A0B5KUM0_9BACT|nr:hypothetical protein [bacterium enrichment culture clone fosmid MGS-K1]